MKSLVAISVFNDLARARGLPFRAISRGTHPDSVVPMAIRDGAAPIEGWDGLPALSSDYGIGRDSIRARVEALVSKLSRERKRSD